jgi:hypothetical protein
MFLVMHVISELHHACVPGNSAIDKTEVNEKLLNHSILP